MDSAKILLKTEANLLLCGYKPLALTRFAPSRFFWLGRFVPFASCLFPSYELRHARRAISYELIFCLRQKTLDIPLSPNVNGKRAIFFLDSSQKLDYNNVIFQ